jgi:hypothetical protein
MWFVVLLSGTITCSSNSIQSSSLKWEYSLGVLKQNKITAHLLLKTDGGDEMTVLNTYDVVLLEELTTVLNGTDYILEELATFFFFFSRIPNSRLF